MKVLYIQPGDRPWFEPEKFAGRKKMYLSRAQFEVGLQIPEEYRVSFLDINLTLKQGATVEQATKDGVRSFQPDVVFISFPTFVQGEQVASILSSIQSVSPEIRVVLGGSVIPLIQGAPLRWWGRKVSCVYGGWGGEIPRLLAPGGYWSNPLGQEVETKMLVENYSPEDLYSARGRLDFKKYVATCRELGISPMGNIEMTRGCPFSCGFCSLNRKRLPFQVRTPVTALRETEFLLKSGIDYLHVIDPTFGLPPKESASLLRGMRDLRANFPQAKFEVLTRADLITEEFAQLLSQAGVVRCGIGMETMDRSSLDSVDKKSSPEKTARAARILSSHGIGVKFFHILFPGKFSTETISFFSKMSDIGVRFIVQSSFLRDLPNPESAPHFLEQDQTFFVPGKDSKEQAMEWMLSNLAFPSMDTDENNGGLRQEIRKRLMSGKSLESMFVTEGTYVRLGDYVFEPGPLVPIAERVFNERG